MSHQAYGKIMKTFVTLTMVVFIATTFLTNSVSAAEATPTGWDGEVSLTASQTSGNTNTTDVGFGLKLERVGDKWEHKFNSLVDYGRANGVANNRLFEIGYQLNRKISERVFTYANVDYFNDEFGAFEEGYFIGVGGGYKVLTSETMQWGVEAGAGYRSQTTQGPLSFTENEIAFRGASDFDYKINEAVSLYNNTEILSSSSDTYIWNEIGLSSKISGALSARFSFRVDYHTNAPFGTNDTDTITRFGIVYSL